MRWQHPGWQSRQRTRRYFATTTATSAAITITRCSLSLSDLICALGFRLPGSMLTMLLRRTVWFLLAPRPTAQ